MPITVITNQRFRRNRPGSVIVVEDSPVIRALIQRGRLSLVDPPSLELIDADKSSSKTSTDSELHDKPKRSSSQGSRKASRKSSGEGESDSPGGSGEPEGFAPDYSYYSEGEADRQDHE